MSENVHLVHAFWYAYPSKDLKCPRRRNILMWGKIIWKRWLHGDLNLHRIAYKSHHDSSTAIIERRIDHTEIGHGSYLMVTKMQRGSPCFISVNLKRGSVSSVEQPHEGPCRKGARISRVKAWRVKMTLMHGWMDGWMDGKLRRSHQGNLNGTSGRKEGWYTE